MPTTLEVLSRARELISQPNGWCQEYSAIDQTGLPVDTQDDRACSFCTIGAVWRVSPQGIGNTQAFLYLEGALKQLHPETETLLSVFNDSHTHAEVLAIFDKAIENANPGPTPTSP